MTPLIEGMTAEELEPYGVTFEPDSSGPGKFAVRATKPGLVWFQSGGTITFTPPKEVVDAREGIKPDAPLAIPTEIPPADAPAEAPTAPAETGGDATTAEPPPAVEREE